MDTTLWCFSPGDHVLAIGKLGHTLYLGGSFLYVGPSTGGGVPCDAHTAAPLPSYPRVVGRVYTVVADGQGGWYIGGLFSYVGGQPRANLAHILPDGSVAAWAPDPDLQVGVITLAGGVVYVGGDFNFVGGEPRAHLVALSPSSSTPLPWTCDINSRVTSLVASGQLLYVGGWFSFVAGQPRSFVAAVDLASGAPTPWQVNLDDRVNALAMHDTTLFIGGYFWTADADTHRCVVAVGASTGAVHTWNARVDRQPPSSLDFGPHINAMLFSGESLFVAGSFTHIGGQARQSLAQLDVRSGLATGWDPRAFRQTRLGPEFLSMALSGDTLLVAGPCDSIGGKVSGQASALSVRTAEKLVWDPLTNDVVFALALQGNVVFVGGQFTSVRDWVLRPGLAAIDELTGHVTDWDPHPDDYVQSLLVHGGKIYVGGYFGSVGGQVRFGIAALDPVTGRATPWDPSANGSVWSMAPLGGAVITAGLFSQIGGRFIRGLAAIDTSTGLATAWTPNAGGDMYAVAVTDSVIYVGGDYLTMGGQPRRSIAAVDPVTGEATPWNPGTDGLVDAIALLNGTIYIGGFFHTVGGLPRDFLAAVDRSGSVTPWAPNAFGPNGNAEVEALVASDSTVFAGGFFSGVSGESRDYFAAMDARTGAVRLEYPHPDGPVWALAESGGTVYVGGAFGHMGPWPQVALAAIGPRPSVPRPISSRLLLAQSAPNPAISSALVRYSIPAALSVSLTIFDLQGRRSASVLSHVFQSAGPHQVSVRTDGLRAGCYLYCLEAGTLRATRKMVVVK
ncbi:MAG TPA: T9SS type A sorting domain-containing protein [Candidatus Eisenbacteria bacterium]